MTDRTSVSSDLSHHQQDRLAQLNGVDRQVLFSNENFIIGMLQAASLTSLIAVVTGKDAIIAFSSAWAHATLVTIATLALIGAMGAGYFKHQYKVWDIKGHREKFSRSLRLMRISMLLSTVAFCIGAIIVPAALWIDVFLNVCR